MKPLSKDANIQFKNLSHIPGLTHAISTRLFGSMKDHGTINFPTINSFLKALKIPADRLVLSEQVHGGDIKILNKVPAEKVIKNVDGLITSKRNIILGIITADCLPIFFYDRNKKIIAAAHAGYKSLSKLIIKHMIDELKKLGSNPKDLSVCIGPGIGVCCYEVARERIKIFQEIFPTYTNWFRLEGDNFFLDLKRIAFLNLKELGVNPEYIEILDICTVHQVNLFFSFRKEGKNCGEFIGIIGRR